MAAELTPAVWTISLRETASTPCRPNSRSAARRRRWRVASPAFRRLLSAAVVTEAFRFRRDADLGEGVELARADDDGADLHAQLLLQALLDRRADAFELGRVAVAHDRDDELVAVVLAHGAHEVVVERARDRACAVADGLGPHVDAAQLDHVVAAAGERAHPSEPAPARALAGRVEVRQVHDVVPELGA